MGWSVTEPFPHPLVSRADAAWRSIATTKLGSLIWARLKGSVCVTRLIAIGKINGPAGSPPASMASFRPPQLGWGGVGCSFVASQNLLHRCCSGLFRNVIQSNMIDRVFVAFADRASLVVCAPRCLPQRQCFETIIVICVHAILPFLARCECCREGVTFILNMFKLA